MKFGHQMVKYPKTVYQENKFHILEEKEQPNVLTVINLTEKLIYQFVNAQKRIGNAILDLAEQVILNVKVKKVKKFKLFSKKDFFY